MCPRWLWTMTLLRPMQKLLLLIRFVILIFKPKNVFGFYGSHKRKKVYILARDPFRRLVFWLNTNEVFLETIDRNYIISEVLIYICRNGIPAADCPISANDYKRLYFNTISDLAYIENGHGRIMTHFPNHFTMVFDLTSTQQCLNYFTHLEQTNHLTSVELRILAALPKNIEILIIGKEASKIFVDSACQVSKNHMPTN